MTTDYFSVDRRGFYNVGRTLDLFKQNPFPFTYLAVEDFISPADLASHLNGLFPAGLSLHGWDFMTRHLDFQRNDVTAINYANYESTLELVLEYVRRTAFAASPSRLQSYFAFESLQAAREFRTNTQPIYRIQADTVLRLDQRWLRHGNQSVIGSYCAHKYWSGAAVTNPKWEHMLVPPVRVVERVE